MATPAQAMAAARAAKVAELAAAAKAATPKSLWLPSYDRRVPEGLMFHGSDSAEISGPFVPGRRDSGWFGRGMYATKYPEYASRWGSNVYASPVPDVPFAHIWTDDGYRQMHYDKAAKRADARAGGSDAFADDERAYSQAFRDALMADGYGGVRVGIGGHPDAEIVIFDPDKAGVVLSPFASRMKRTGGK